MEFGRLRAVTLVAIATAGSVLTTGTASSQASSGPPMPPSINLTDENHVDLLSGSTSFPITLGSLGSGDLGISLTVSYQDQGDYGSINSHSNLQAFMIPDRNSPNYLYYYIGRNADVVYSATQTGSANSSNGGKVVYNADGTQVLTDRNGTIMQMSATKVGTSLFATTVMYPTGKTLRYNGNVGGDYPSAWSVTQNNGLMAKRNINGDYVIINLAYEYCTPNTTVNCALANPWPSAHEATSPPNNWSITDASGGTYQIGMASYANAIATYHDKQWAPGVTVTYDRCRRQSPVNCYFSGVAMYDRVISSAKNGVTWSFNYVTGLGPGGYLYQTTSPFNRQMYGYAVSGSPGHPERYQDEYGKTIKYDNTENARLTSITYPEGNSETYTYDARGNLANVLRTPKSGSGLASTNIQASYDSSCGAPAKCNKANFVVDANGFRTDFTYDVTTGLLLSESGPAVSSIRPVRRFHYVQRKAWYLNSLGAYAQDPQAIWLLDTEKTCRTGSTVGDACSIPSEEIVTAYDYGPDSGPNNLWTRGISVTAGGVSRRTCFGYDRLGNRISQTSPRASLTACP